MLNIKTKLKEITMLILMTTIVHAPDPEIQPSAASGSDGSTKSEIVSPVPAECDDFTDDDFCLVDSVEFQYRDEFGDIGHDKIMMETMKIKREIDEDKITIQCHLGPGGKGYFDYNRVHIDKSWHEDIERQTALNIIFEMAKSIRGRTDALIEDLEMNRRTNCGPDMKYIRLSFARVKKQHMLYHDTKKMFYNKGIDIGF